MKVVTKPGKSLKGKLIVLTRSTEGSAPWIKYLEERGARVYLFPAIEIAPVALTPKIKNILKNISDFDWVVFTSAAGVRALKELTATVKINIPRARAPKIAAIGVATAKAVRAAGYRVAFQPSTPSSAALAFELEPVRDRSILLLRTAIAPHDMHKVLTARGANVTELSIYKTVLRSDPDPKFEKLLARGRIDFLTFASPSAVRGFFKRVPPALRARARTLPAIAIGASVAASLRKAGFKDVRTASEATIEGMMEAVG